MKKDNSVYLKLIVDAIEKIYSYVNGMCLDDFLNDSKTQSAVIMQLQVIGELSKKVPEDVKEHIRLPWKQISGLRDIISHDYFSLDIELVWNILDSKITEVHDGISVYLSSGI